MTINRCFPVSQVHMWLLLACCVGGLINRASAQDEVSLRLMEDCATSYRFSILSPNGNAKPSDKVSVSIPPLLRWNNQVVREDDAGLFVWTFRKRPIAIAQFFRQGDEWQHELQSITSIPFECEYRDGWKWSPKTSSLKWREVPDMPIGPSEQVRLLQMRTIAREFVGRCRPEHLTSSEELRLLTTPTYRYASEADQIVDGAIFAYAQGTNPEILILIEAIQNGGSDGNSIRYTKDTWRYAFAPMTCFQADVRRVIPNRAPEVMWEQVFQTIPTTDASSVYQFRFRVHSHEQWLKGIEKK